MKKGMTLLEVVIATAILALVMSTLYLLLFATTRSSTQEMILRDAQHQLQLRMDEITKDLRESKQSIIRVYDFNDPLMPTADQTVLVIPTARDVDNNFQVVNATPSWQRVIVYAPRWNPDLKTGELRRYVIDPCPDEFKDEINAPAFTITADEITIGTAVIDRASGDRLMTKLDYLKTGISGGNVSLDISVEGSAVVQIKNVDLQSGAKGRN